MFCPHCHNKIPDGSNICPLCYSNLAGVKAQQAQEPRPQVGGEEQAPRKKTSSSGKPAYTKGSRGSRKKKDNTPMIIAFGLIVILIVIIVMIVRSMFGAGTGTVGTQNAQQPVVTVTNTPAQNFIVFGATSTPQKTQVVTPTPNLEVTPTPAPQATAQASYKTLRKNDQGQDVVMLQQALVELGYLSGAQDGIYGTGTLTAVKAFQQDHELDADGIAGKMTLEKLYSLVAITPMPEVTVGPGDIMDLPG
jgi:hypothetical protein